MTTQGYIIQKTDKEGNKQILKDMQGLNIVFLKEQEANTTLAHIRICLDDKYEVIPIPLGDFKIDINTF